MIGRRHIERLDPSCPEWLRERVAALVRDLSDLCFFSIQISAVQPGVWNVEGRFAERWTKQFLAQTGQVPSERAVLQAAGGCLDTLARGHKAIIRDPPGASLEKDFETDAMIAKGYARLAVFDEEGEWTRSVYARDGDSVRI